MEKWTSTVHEQEVDVYLPKFTMTSEFSLKNVLQAMGMTAAFDSQADFSGMNGKKDLYLSAVVHKAFVDVNEEGTEAAAATGVIVETASRPSHTNLSCRSPFRVSDSRRQDGKHPIHGTTGKSTEGIGMIIRAKSIAIHLPWMYSRLCTARNVDTNKGQESHGYWTNETKHCWRSAVYSLAV